MTKYYRLDPTSVLIRRTSPGELREALTTLNGKFGWFQEDSRHINIKAHEDRIIEITLEQYILDSKIPDSNKYMTQLFAYFKNEFYKDLLDENTP